MASSFMVSVGAIMVWMCLSMTVIFFNAALLGSFRHPIALTCWHMVVSCMLVTCIQICKPGLLETGDEANGIPPLTLRRSVQLGMPVALVGAFGLVSGNMAYLYLTVSFIQMIKAWTSSAVYITGCLLGTQRWSRPVAKTLLTVTIGLTLASLGEVNFDALGFVIQVMSMSAESLRINMLEIRLKSQGYKLNPLSSMKIFAPLIMCTLGTMLLLLDREALDLEVISAIGWGTFTLNGMFACCLNLAVFLCIQVASGLVYALSGVVKDLMIVSGAAIFRGDSITPLQVVGYTIAILGIQAYSVVSKEPAGFEAGVAPELARRLCQRLGLRKPPEGAEAEDRIDARDEELKCIVGASTDREDSEAEAKIRRGSYLKL